MLPDTMTTDDYLHRLHINRPDRIASEQSGLPSLFYTIKRCYGDEQASSYLRAYQKANPLLANVPIVLETQEEIDDYFDLTNEPEQVV